MKKTTISKLVKKAVSLQERGKNWHFHMLSPACSFNRRKDMHAFVLESSSESYVAYSKKPYNKYGKSLVKLLHGSKILGKKGTRKSIGRRVRRMLELAKRYNKDGMLWHHHMLFPNCILNGHKGKWCILFEDEPKGGKIESVSKTEPTESLRRIELLFYSRK
ncbi:Uncharacterised protein [uncultured archaeon]|nr:Uncharacterised protein [uncultured archaeon]